MRLTRLLSYLALAVGLVPPRPLAAGALDRPAVGAIVFSRTIEGSFSGNCFFIGDGTLLVTAGHVDFPGRRSGLHRGEAMVTVLSPHLGDAVEMHLIARDDEPTSSYCAGPGGGIQPSRRRRRRRSSRRSKSS